MHIKTSKDNLDGSGFNHRLVCTGFGWRLKPALRIPSVVLTVLGLEARAGTATAVLSGAIHGQLKVGKQCSILSVLNLYWINRDDLQGAQNLLDHKAGAQAQGNRGLISIRKQNYGLGKGHRYNHTPARSIWKKHDMKFNPNHFSAVQL
ncbi:hypothetical protein DFH08DRAFT_824965 [Mycena albidolilacea]|uniref:Uncharacterized protein n=1 Tax=Mycena albidolilacea TaxID=1033008 RepID=A0AAD6Z303_9AGAR|nr:hypothetical protein DFH08DRAFT_824965 [Mycena albidolilacea]